MPGTDHLAATQAFFGPRAAGWDERFPDDHDAFVAAIDELGLRPGATVVDAGCGTGRVLPLLREAVGPTGVVVGLDPVPEMVDVARRRRSSGELVLGDALAAPLADASVDAILASGLLPHVPDVAEALRELARITRPGGALAVFHPISRAALAARHGRELGPNDPLDPANLAPVLVREGWTVELVDDGERLLVLARRRVALLPAAEARLGSDEELLWLTTVDGQGQPQTSPVWFVWVDGALVAVSSPDAGKIANLSGNRRVAAHLDGPHVVTIEGIARAGGPLAGATRDAYLVKYATGLARLGTDPAAYLSEFATTVRIVPTRARVFDTR